MCIKSKPHTVYVAALKRIELNQLGSQVTPHPYTATWKVHGMGARKVLDGSREEQESARGESYRVQAALTSLQERSGLYNYAYCSAYVSSSFACTFLYKYGCVRTARSIEGGTGEC